MKITKPPKAPPIEKLSDKYSIIYTLAYTSQTPATLYSKQALKAALKDQTQGPTTACEITLIN